MLQSIDFLQIELNKEFIQGDCKYIKSSNALNSMNSFNLTKNECSIVSGEVQIEVEYEEEVEWESE